MFSCRSIVNTQINRQHFYGGGSFLFMFVLLGKDKKIPLIEMDTECTPSVGALMALTWWGPPGAPRGMLHMWPCWPLTLTASSSPLMLWKKNNSNPSLLIKICWQPGGIMRGSESSLTRPGEDITHSQRRAKLLTTVAPLVLWFNLANNECILVQQLDITAWFAISTCQRPGLYQGFCGFQPLHNSKPFPKTYH